MVVRLSDILPFVLRHDIHRGDEPEGGVAPLNIKPELRIDMVLYTVGHRDMRLLVVIDTLQDQGVFLSPAKNNAGHTREYAQHYDL